MVTYPNRETDRCTEPRLQADSPTHPRLTLRPAPYVNAIVIDCPPRRGQLYERQTEKSRSQHVKALSRFLNGPLTQSPNSGFEGASVPDVSVYLDVVESIGRRGYDPSFETRDPLHLFAHVRKVYGMRVNDSCHAYWDWRPLRAELDTLWQVLTVEAGRLYGRPIRAEVWATMPTRTVDDVLELLRRCNAVAPMKSVVGVTERRPTAALNLGGSPILSALSSTLGAIHVATSRPYVSLLAEVIGNSETQSDEELLDAADRLAEPFRGKPIVGATDPVPRQLNRGIAAVEARLTSGGERIGLTRFSVGLTRLRGSTDWSDWDDKQLVRSLLRFAPETAVSARKQLERYGVNVDANGLAL